MPCDWMDTVVRTAISKNTAIPRIAFSCFALFLYPKQPDGLIHRYFDKPVIVGDTAHHEMPVQLQLYDYPAISHAQERR